MILVVSYDEDHTLAVMDGLTAAAGTRCGSTSPTSPHTARSTWNTRPRDRPAVH